MGAVQDKFTSNANYTRRMNEVEYENQRALQKLELEKIANKNENEREREKLEMQKQKAKADFELKRAELLVAFQTDVRKIEAELIKTRMVTQSSLFEKFIDFMKETLTTNDALILQQTKLYELAGRSENKADFFIAKAEKVDILSAKQLIDIGAEKVKDLNLESSKEMQYLESKLEHVLEIPYTTSNLGIAQH